MAVMLCLLVGYYEPSQRSNICIDANSQTERFLNIRRVTAWSTSVTLCGCLYNWSGHCDGVDRQSQFIHMQQPHRWPSAPQLDTPRIHLHKRKQIGNLDVADTPRALLATRHNSLINVPLILYRSIGKEGLDSTLPSNKNKTQTIQFVTSIYYWLYVSLRYLCVEIFNLW